jgi:uncharacterized membrane protein YqaE (UPF0057 family)
VSSKVPLIILCLFFPFIAVLIHDGPSKKVLWAAVLQLLGHIPAVIYGISQVLNDLAPRGDSQRLNDVARYVINSRTAGFPPAQRG